MWPRGREANKDVRPARMWPRGREANKDVRPARMWPLWCVVLLVAVLDDSSGTASPTPSPQSDTVWRKCCAADFVLSWSLSDNYAGPRCVPAARFSSTNDGGTNWSSLPSGENVGFPNCSAGVLLIVDPAAGDCVDYVAEDISVAVNVSEAVNMSEVDNITEEVNISEVANMTEEVNMSETASKREEAIMSEASDNNEAMFISEAGNMSEVENSTEAVNMSEEVSLSVEANKREAANMSEAANKNEVVNITEAAIMSEVTNVIKEVDMIEASNMSEAVNRTEAANLNEAYNMSEAGNLTIAANTREAAIPHQARNKTGIIGLICEGRPPLTPKTTLKKCCPDGYTYNMAQHTCYPANTTEDATGNLLDRLSSDSPLFDDIAYGMPNCSEAMIDFIFDNRTISGVTVEDVQSDLVCVDHIHSSDLIGGRRCVPAKNACSANRPCVRKCCPPGEHMKSKKCSSGFGRGFNVTFHDVAELSRPVVTLLATTEYGILHGIACANGLGKYPLLHHENAEDVNYLSTAGTIHYKDIRLTSDEYCIEDVHIPRKRMDGLFTFACVKQEHQTPYNASDLFYILLSVCLILSCLFLLATLAVYSCLPSLQNLHGMTLMCNVASFLAAFICLAIVQVASLNTLSRGTHLVLCRTLGFTTLFAFLAAFAWMNIMCFDIWWTFGGVRSVNRDSRKQRERRRFAWYSLYAWGLPTVITATAVTFDLVDNLAPNMLKPKMGEEKCWFKRADAPYSELLFFILPLATLVTCNLVLFVMTARTCSKVKAEINRMQKSTDDRRKKKFQADLNKLIMNGKLFVVMGVNWGLEVVGFVFPSLPRAWVFLPDAFNALVGVLIFAIFVLKGKVLNALADRFGITCGRRRREAAPKTGETRSMPNYRDPRKSSMSSTCLTATTFSNDVTSRKLSSHT